MCWTMKKLVQTQGWYSFPALANYGMTQRAPAANPLSSHLHRSFWRLMERFDLSYRVAGISRKRRHRPVSLIAQLVPDNRPEKKT